MQKIDFTGAVLTKIERTSKEGRAHFSASLTDSLSKAMEWGELPDGAISVKMDGDIPAQTATLVPTDKELREKGIEFGITKVDGFQVVRLEVERTKGVATRREVRFVVGFAGVGICALLESYMTRLGDTKAKLTVSYIEQQKLVEQPAE